MNPGSTLCICYVSLVGFVTAFQVPLPPPQRHHDYCRTTSSLTELGMSTTVVDISQSTERDIGTMDEWAAAYGVQKAEGFEYTSEDGQDIGVMTTKDMATGSPVLFVPNDLILSSSAAQQELTGPALDEAEALLEKLGVGNESPQFALFLKILLEYEKGDQSPWFPWLNAMPRNYYNGASMTPFCYDCLPPLVANLAMKERTKFIYFTEALKTIDFLSYDINYNKELARWAFQIVLTRAIGDDNEQRIAPIADMFNHGTETEIELSFDDEGNCYAYTTTDVPAGSALRVSYGDPTNPSYFFARYGFLDETSPATFCKIMLKPTQQLQDMGYDYSRMLFFKGTGDVSEEVWDVLLYQNLASNREAQQAFYQAHMTGDAETKSACHQQYFPETLASLREHVDTFLVQLDELSAKAAGKDFNEHPRLPLIIRHNDFVKETFQAVKASLDQY